MSAFEREPGVWSVEKIDDDGGIEQAIFIGPGAERRCREYAALDAAAAIDGDAGWDAESVAKALWQLDCERSAEDYRREKKQAPEKFADPWHESGCGIRQQQRYMREAETFLAAIRSLKRLK